MLGPCHALQPKVPSTHYSGGTLMIDFTNAPARALVAAVCMALSSQVASAQAVNATPVRKSSLGLDIYEASEVV